MNKTKKQQFLDQEATSLEMAATQELTRTLSKTQITNAIRAFKSIDESLYKSAYKDLPFSRIYEALLSTYAIVKTDENGNEMES